MIVYLRAPRSLGGVPILSRAAERGSLVDSAGREVKAPRGLGDEIEAWVRDLAPKPLDEACLTAQGREALGVRRLRVLAAAGYLTEPANRVIEVAPAALSGVRPRRVGADAPTPRRGPAQASLFPR